MGSEVAMSSAAVLVGPPSLRTAGKGITSNGAVPMEVDPHVGGAGSSSSDRRHYFEHSNLKSSGDPLVDLFFNFSETCRLQRTQRKGHIYWISKLLDAAWARDPATTLKLICHIRGVRGCGKANKEGFYVAALWLHGAHPKTLAGNLAAFVEFGYIKDLLEILLRIIQSRDGDEIGMDWRRRRASMDEEELKEEKRKKTSEAARKAIELYSSDADYRFLFDCVVEFFAALLKSDLESLNAGDVGKIGLAAKWCPSLDSSYDKATLICEAIARRIFPRESSAEYAGLADEHYAYRVRTRLRREVLTPLRKCLELPEVYMSAGQWSSIPYARLASVALNRYSKVFLKHDAPGITEFLDDEAELRTIPTGAVLPHEIAKAAREGDRAAELQWRSMVAAVKKVDGKLQNCVAAFTDYAPHKEAALALGLLVSELSEEPWKGRLIGSKLLKIEGETLKEKMEYVKLQERGSYRSYNDVPGVFDEILRVAAEGNLPADKMVRRVFLLGTMAFSEWEREYLDITCKFKAAGYAVPEIVFWNLGNDLITVCRAFVPVVSAQKGVALVSGYSKNLLRVLMKADFQQLTPEAVMKEAISGPEYDKLVALD